MHTSKISDIWRAPQMQRQIPSWRREALLLKDMLCRHVWRTNLCSVTACCTSRAHSIVRTGNDGYCCSVLQWGGVLDLPRHVARLVYSIYSLATMGRLHKLSFLVEKPDFCMTVLKNGKISHYLGSLFHWIPSLREGFFFVFLIGAQIEDCIHEYIWKDLNAYLYLFRTFSHSNAVVRMAVLKTWELFIPSF